MVRDTVRRFTQDVIAPKAAEIDAAATFSEDTWTGLAELGLCGIPIGEAWGGAGMSSVAYVLAVEEISRACGSTGLTLAAHTSLGTYPIYAWGSDDLKERYLRQLASGEWMGAYGLTEPGAGSDSGGTKTTAERDGGDYVLNGAKCFITNAHYAQTFICTAVTDPDAGPSGISAFVVERDMPGFEVTKGEEKLGMRGSDWGGLVFQDCRIPAANVVGPEGEGFKTFLKTLDAGRISIGALGLGIGEGAYARALSHARERTAFGKPLIEQQAVAFKIADMATGLAGARHHIYHAARLKDAGLPFTREAAMAKLVASEVAMKVTFDAIQILGGYGFCTEYEVERMYRDAKLCTIGEGTSEIQRIVISRSIVKEQT